MNWKDLEVSENQTYFHIGGVPVFDRIFLEVLKFHAPGIAPVKDATGAFHINGQGEDLYSFRFDRSFGYYCSRAAVCKDSLWFHLDENGQVAYSQRFTWTGNFQENVCTVRNERNEYFHIDLSGNPCYESSLVYAGDFKDGVACVKTNDGSFRHIMKDGSFFHPYQYEDLGVFHKGFATAKDQKGWFHINKQGAPLYDQRYLFVEPFYNGQALVTCFDGSKRILNEEGVEILRL
jgi:hypothetical protein